MGWVLHATPRLPCPRERPGTPCIGGWVGPRAGLDGCGKSCSPTRIRSSDHPVRRESLCWLRYPGTQAATRSYGKEKILEFERGRSKSHALENSLWTSLGTCFKTPYMILMVTGVQTPHRPSLDLTLYWLHYPCLFYLMLDFWIYTSGGHFSIQSSLNVS